MTANAVTNVVTKAATKAATKTGEVFMRSSIEPWLSPDANPVYWDQRFKRQVVKLLPGEVYVNHGDEMVVTVLGSCVSVCLYERVLGIGGINHFLLPYETINENEIPSPTQLLRAQGLKPDAQKHSTRYGNFAMMSLINEIIQRGGLRCNLQAKIFGGAHVTDTSLDIGAKNIEFVKAFLNLEGIETVSEDLGGTLPRKLYYIPSSNTVFIKCQHTHNSVFGE